MSCAAAWISRLAARRCRRSRRPDHADDRLLDNLPQVGELDLNPVIVTPDGGAAVDARIRVALCEPPPPPSLRRLR
ncbi:acetate--CoA ligase family protein [Nonomuraea rosea]|uniref:acetate--CoA ligase family protein n=1 Tax=Nonomuraea rosea TaxID=638574 RepID=UPI003CD0B0EE